MEALNLKISILTASAYVALCLGDYVVALEYSRTLLAINKLPGAHWLLGNLYAAESLIFLDKINEAIEYLKPESLRDTSTFIPIVDTGGDRQDREKVVEDDIEQKLTKGNDFTINHSLYIFATKFELLVGFEIKLSCQLITNYP